MAFSFHIAVASIGNPEARLECGIWFNPFTTSALQNPSPWEIAHVVLTTGVGSESQPAPHPRLFGRRYNPGLGCDQSVVLDAAVLLEIEYLFLDIAGQV